MSIDEVLNTLNEGKHENSNMVVHSYPTLLQLYTFHVGTFEAPTDRLREQLARLALLTLDQCPRCGARSSLDIDNWKLKEVDRLLGSFTDVYFYTTKGTFSKKLAYDEVKQDLAKVDAERRRSATKAIMKYYGKRVGPKGLIPLDDTDTAEFWALVQDAIDNPD